MPRCCPFRLVDGMILVAAATLGLAAMRPGWNQSYTFWPSAKTDPAVQDYAGMAQLCYIYDYLYKHVAGPGGSTEQPA